MHELSYQIGNAAQPVSNNSPVIIAHVVNDQGGWGSGFTRSLSVKFIASAGTYRVWSQSAGFNPSVPFKLGETLVVAMSENVEIAHLLAQHGYKNVRNPVPLDYTALRSSLSKLAEHVSTRHANPPIIQMPRIGSGLAGGKWSSIEPLIRETLLPVAPVVVFDLPAL